MKKYASFLNLPILLVIVMLTPLIIASCDDEEDYTTSPRVTLQFSADTIRFDTVFTSIGSSTMLFKVYNPSDESLLIPSVGLAGKGSTGFRVNVDGMTGHTFNNVELRAGDSLFVFVEVTVDPHDQDTPFLVQDSLVFNLASGLRQQVLFEAVGQDMIPLYGPLFSRDTTLTGHRPYVIYDSLVVAEGVTLRLTEGTRLYFHDGAFCRVAGTLHAEGSRQRPVVFRGDRLDRMFSYLPYDRLDSQWEGITIQATSFDNYLNYVDIHSGNYGIVCDSSDLSRDKLTIENSVIHNVAGDALRGTNCRIWVGNTQLTNAGGHTANVRGGDVQFFFSTLANFYPWDLRGAALCISNRGVALERADFRSCLITGYSSNELMVVRDTVATMPLNYHFDHCLLNIPSDSISNERYVEVIPDSVEAEVSRIAHFPKIDTDIFYYDFSLDSLSTARGRGNIEDARLYYPTDRNGRSRLIDEAPDAGAYEY